jgi:hypothetical protein
MGPLVYYCRWHNARLRLHGRDRQIVWGDLVFTRADQEQTQPFRFNQNTWELTLIEDGLEKTLQLDELGVVTTTADDALQ